MTALTTLFATFVLIVLYTAIDILFSRKVFWIKNVAFAVFSFFGTFLVVSALLFAFNLYSFWTAYSICFGAGIAVAGLIVRKSGTKFPLALRKLPQFREYPQHFWRCLTVLLILGVIVSFSKNEFFGMGQDQGVYQTAGIYRTAGYNDVQIDLPGYHALNMEADRELYYDQIIRARSSQNREERTQTGFNSNIHQHHLYYEPLSDVAGFFHGIPNFGALLSVSGRIFGISGMTHINTLFILASIVLLFLTLNYNLKLKISTSTFITGIFILSPIVIWSSKAALTECFLALIFISFIYLITSEHKHTKWLLWLPVTVFSFYHVSIFTMLPMFMLVFVILYLQKRDNAIIVSGLVSLAAYFAGFFTMVHISNAYTVNNYISHIRQLIPLPELNYQTFLMSVFLVTLTAVVLFSLICFIIKKKDITLSSKVFLTVNKYITLLFVAYITTDRFIFYFKGRLPPTFEYLLGFPEFIFRVPLFSYALLTGIVILPVLLFGIFLKYEVFAKKTIAPVAVMFFYCVLIYSAVFKKDIQHFYYFARYLTPFIPIILTLAAVYLDSFKPKIRASIAAVAIAFIFPLAVLNTIQKDHSRIYWKGFNQVISAVDRLGKDDVVVVAKEAMTYFFLPLNAMTDSIILPEADSDYRFVDDMLSNTDGAGSIYYLSMYGGDNPFYLAVYDVEVEYDGYRSDSSAVFETHGRVSLPGLIPPLPLELSPSTYNVYLTEVTGVGSLSEMLER